MASSSSYTWTNPQCLSWISHRRRRRHNVVLRMTILSLLLISTITMAQEEEKENHNDNNIRRLMTTTHHFVSWYMDCLENAPVRTKSLTTALIQFLGDYCAQWYEAYRILVDVAQLPLQNTNTQSNHHHHHPKRQRRRQRFLYRWWKQIQQDYDFRRGIALFADGLFLSGPLLHYAFEWMEHWLPTTPHDDDHPHQAAMAALLHVLANDYLIDTLYLALSFVFVALAEGHVSDLPRLFQKDFVATVQASWMTSLALIPIEFLCFRYASVHWRVLAMNFIDILWGAIVSFVAHTSRREEAHQQKEKTRLLLVVVGDSSIEEKEEEEEIKDKDQ